MDHTKMWYRMGKEYPNIEFVQMCSKRMSIDRFRNEAMRIALQSNFDYIFFIDDDMLLPPNTFNMLYYESSYYHIISALNYIRGYPFKIMSFKWDLAAGRRRLVNIVESDLPDPIGTVVKVDAIGTAVCLIRVAPFRQVPAPWFLTGPHGTEDIYMCLKATDYVPYIKIGTHTGVITGHLLEPEVISHHTRAAHLRYIESFMTTEEIQKARAELPGIAQVPLRDNNGNFRAELTYEELMGIEFAINR